MNPERSILRQRRDEDREPFAAMNRYAREMRFFPHTCSAAESNGFVDRNARRIAGRGGATEAARLALEVGPATLDLDEVVSYPAAVDAPSIAVVRELATVDDAVGFEHPRIDPGSPLRPHAVYRLPRERWRAARERSAAPSDSP